jgi:anti-sigma B factor antagonist
MSGAGSRRRCLVVEDNVNGITVVNFVDKEIRSEADIEQLGAELSSLVDGPRKIVLNFGNLTYLSSETLGKLITAHRSIQAAGGGLRLCCLAPRIREIFRITTLAELFDIRKDEPAALDGF